MFPASRFIQAGATPDQVARLQADFDAMPADAQQSYLDRIGGLAIGDLAELVAALVAPEPEVDAEPKAQPAIAGAGPGETFAYPIVDAEPAPE